MARQTRVFPRWVKVAFFESTSDWSISLFAFALRHRALWLVKKTPGMQICSNHQSKDTVVFANPVQPHFSLQALIFAFNSRLLVSQTLRSFLIFGTLKGEEEYRKWNWPYRTSILKDLACVSCFAMFSFHSLSQSNNFCCSWNSWLLSFVISCS